jgi:hypothetical protein
MTAATAHSKSSPSETSIVAFSSESPSFRAYANQQLIIGRSCVSETHMNLKLVLGPLSEDWQDMVKATDSKEDKVFALGA